jgi:NAD(P)-dependent dehydrogenase (short-subunit alcohol dehydrogenase family)
VARAAAADGWKVAVNYLRDEAAAQGVVEAIVAAGGLAEAVRGDATSPADIEALFAAVDLLGPLKGLVNNAGGSADFRIAEMTEADYARILDANLRSTAFCSAAAVRRMAGGGGAIVNIGSLASRTGGQALRVMYAAAKGAVDSFTIGLANEVGKQGIRVNCVRPGVIATESHAAKAGPDRLRQITAGIALGRPGEPDEVAQVVAFLLSDRSSYMTGALIDIGGGR